jgi:hypothetical protein
MKYIEKVKDDLREVLINFLANEPEYNEEYLKILELYKEVDFYIVEKKRK